MSWHSTVPSLLSLDVKIHGAYIFSNDLPNWPKAHQGIDEALQVLTEVTTKEPVARPSMSTSDERKFILRRLLIQTVLASLAAAATGTCFAHEYSVGSLRIHHPVTEATQRNQSGIGVYMEIANDSATADRLVAVSSDLAPEAMLHTMSHGGGAMHAEPGLDIPAKGRVSLKPGGAHVMLSGLTRPLKAGERFPLRLVFKRAGAVLVDVQVEAPAR